MNVSRRHITIAISALASALALSAGGAIAGGGNPCCGSASPGLGVPGVNITPPSMPGIGGPGYGGGGMPTTNPCCDGPKAHGVFVPGVSVPAPSVSVITSGANVVQGGVSVTGAQFSSSTLVLGGVSESGGTTFISGGGSYFAPSGVAPSAVGGLNVEGGSELVTERVIEQVPMTQTSCVARATASERVRPVRAVCMDDSGTPHPASRLDDALEVGAGYRGEVFRCVAGTAMQVTLGEMVDGQASFEQGESFSCAKGEALMYGPGGALSCAPQAPQRNCNERSLLRRFGPGIKLVRMTGAGAVCEPVTRTVMQSVARDVVRERATPPAPIVFDGGVGQGVF